MAQTAAEALAAYKKGYDDFVAEFIKLNKLYADLTDDERGWVKSPIDVAQNLHKDAATSEPGIRTLIRGA